jgi:hydroxymethylglutaryl-CoA lyase
MPDAVKIVECPRDAWQALPVQIPAEAKAAYLRQLIGAGFTHIDAVSFVSPTAVPQMADSERVLELLGPAPEIEILGIVVNARGADRAIRTGAVNALGFPWSISPEFLRRNQHQSPDEALAVLREITASARAASLETVAYISMAFGNPYGEPWSAEAVTEACGRVADAGIRQLSLADTVGAATPPQIAEVVSTVRAAYPELEFGIHLHARRNRAAERIVAAYDAGCRRFDSVLGGLGGCPFAQDALIGNIPTEVLLSVLSDRGAALPVLRISGQLLDASAEIAETASLL